MKDDRLSPLPSAGTDRSTADHVPDTPQTRAPAYRLAFADEEFLCRDELRPVRLQLELLKPQLALDEEQIEGTIVMFGGARIPAPANKDSARTETLAELSRFYDEARTFARLMSERSDGRNDVVTLMVLSAYKTTRTEAENTTEHLQEGKHCYKRRQLWEQQKPSCVVEQFPATLTAALSRHSRRLTWLLWLT